MLELGEHTPVLGLDPSLLGGRKLWWNREVDELHQGLADVREAFLEFGGLLGGGWPGSGLGPDQAERCSEQLAPVRFVGHAVGGDERKSLAVFEAVVVDGAQDGVLVFFGQGAQGMRQARAYRAVSQLVLGRGSQTCSDVHAPDHPLGFSLKQPGNAVVGQALLCEQGTNDPSLIECGEGALW